MEWQCRCMKPSIAGHCTAQTGSFACLFGCSLLARPLRLGSQRDGSPCSVVSEFYCRIRVRLTFWPSCLFGARLVYFGRWSESRPGCPTWDTDSWAGLDMLQLPAVNYTAIFSPLPSTATFYHRVGQQTIVKLILKYTWTPKSCLVQ